MTASRTHSPSHELPVRWPWTGVVGMCALGVAGVGGAVWATVATDALASAKGIGAIVAAALVGALGLFCATVPPHAPTARLRVDAAGVGFICGRWRSSAYFDVVPWDDIEAFMTWQGKDAHWIAVVATEDYRSRNNVRGNVMDRWVAHTLGLPIAGTITGWKGPIREIDELHRVVRLLAPHIPHIDPLDNLRSSGRRTR